MVEKMFFFKQKTGYISETVRDRPTAKLSYYQTVMGSGILPFR